MVILTNYKYIHHLLKCNFCLKIQFSDTRTHARTHRRRTELQAGLVRWLDRSVCYSLIHE